MELIKRELIKNNYNWDLIKLYIIYIVLDKLIILSLYFYYNGNKKFTATYY